MSGSFAVGEQLDAAPGDWTGDQPISLTYQWQSCDSYKDAVTANSPAAYWRLSEAQGATTATDEVSTPANGTYTNMPTLSQSGALLGDTNRSVRFDGAGAYASVSDATKLRPASTFTVEAWVKTSASSGVVVSKANASGVSYALSVASGKAKVSANLSSGLLSATSTASVNDGSWHHLVGTYDGSSMKIYVDAGTAVSAPGSGTPSYTSAVLQIGRDASGNFLNGWIDEVALYSSALSSSSVTTHFNAGSSLTGATCSNISGATASMYSPTSTYLGKRVRVQVTGTNSAGSATASSYAAVVVPDAPVNLDAPEATGTPQQDRVLTADDGTWSGAATWHNPATYQWQRCTPYSSTINTDAPSGYWRLGESSASSTAADDAGQNGGTYMPTSGTMATVGLAGPIANEANTAVEFNGSTQDVSLSSGVSFSSGNFTVEAWFKTTAGSASKMAIWNAGNTSRTRIYLDNGVLKAEVISGANSKTVSSSPTTYNDGAWHYVAFRRNGSTFDVYVDPASTSPTYTGTGSIGGVGTGSPSLIGNDTSNDYFNGMIDEVAAYTTNLSGTQILAHYNARSGGCSNISGATSSTYTLGVSDVGTSVAVRVTRTNDDGSATATSAPLWVVADTGPVNTIQPVVSGAIAGASPGATTTTGSWDAVGSPSYSYQWRTCTPYANKIKNDSAAGYWRLGELADSPMPEAADSSTAGTNYGRWVGSPVMGVTGALARDSDRAVLFDGATQQVNLAQPQIFSNGNFAIEGWFKTTSTATQAIWDNGGDGGKRAELYVTNGYVAARAYSSTIDHRTLTSSLGTYANGDWHYAVFTRTTGSVFTLYVDNAVVAGPTTDTSITNVDKTASAPVIGNDSNNDWFNGTLDDIAVYTGTNTLTSTKIGVHWALGHTDPCTVVSTSSAYSPSSGDQPSGNDGKYLIVTVGASAGGLTGYADSLPVTVRPTGTPYNATLPVLSGKPLVGQQLATTDGQWTGSGTITKSYQWQRCNDYATDLVGTDHPYGYWRLDESPGDNAVDSSGTSPANTGTYYTTPSTSFKLGVNGALSYDASTAVNFDYANSQQVQLSSQYVQFDSGPFTIEGWFRSSDSSRTGLIWSSGKTGTTTHYVEVQANAGKIEGKASDGTNTVTTTSSTSYLDGMWHHVAFVRDNTSSPSTFTLSIDGATVDTKSQSMGDVDTASAYAYISGDINKNHPWPGSLDEIAIYKSVLSASRVQAHFKYATVSGCSNISGATNSTYTVQSADAGHRLVAAVTASGSGSTTASSLASDTIWQPSVGADIPFDQGQARNNPPPLKAVDAASTSYAFEISESSTFEDLAGLSSWSSSSSTWTVAPYDPSKPLKEGKTYYWRVRSKTGGVVTTWSKPRSLEIKISRLGQRDSWPTWKAGPLGVNEATGNLTLSLPSPNYPSMVDGGLNLSIAYNSLADPALDNGFGFGWTLTGGPGVPPVKLVDHTKVSDPNDQFDAMEIVWPDGNADFFNHVGDNKSDIYKAGPGTTKQLFRNKDDTWTLIDNQGSLYTFHSPGSSGDGRLLSAEILAGAPGKSQITYEYNDTPLRLKSLTDPSGKKLTLTWHSLDSSGCPSALLCVTGPDGVTWKYIGGGSGGITGKLVKVNDGYRDLLSITYGTTGGSADRPTVIKNADDLDYTHASAGYRNNHDVEVTYNTDGLATQVDEKHIGSGDSTSTWSFAYHPNISGSAAAQTDAPVNDHTDAPASVQRTADGYTDVTSPRQQGASPSLKTRVYYDDLDNQMETVNLLNTGTGTAYSHTLVAYTRGSQLQWSEDALGNPTDYAFDPVTNALLSKTDPDPDGAGTGVDPPITQYRYDETKIGTNATPGPTLQGLHASYFTNPDFSGRPAVDQTDQSIDFNWSTDGPAAIDYKNDNFSVRWTGLVVIPSYGEGDYTFGLNSDGNASLGVNTTEEVDGVDGSSSVSDATDHAPTTVYTKPIHLKPGEHTILVEYSEKTGTAGVHLRWSCSNCKNSSGDSNPIGDQIIPNSALAPNWLNQTSVVKPRGVEDAAGAQSYPSRDLSFSHFSAPQTGQPDYTEQKNGSTALITTYNYDSYGRMTNKISPRGTTGASVDSNGNLNGTVDAAYAATWTYYTASPTASLSETAANPTFCGGGSAVNQGGLLKSQQPPATVATTYIYDAAGRPLAKSNEVGTACSGYDTNGEGRLVSTKDADGTTTTYTYDPSGTQMTETKDPGSSPHLNLTAATVYDESGAAISKTDANSHTTTFAHDLEGNQTQVVVDPGTGHLNLTTTTAYDGMGRKTSSTVDPGSSPHLNLATQVGYDLDGHQTSTTTPEGIVTTTDYDNLGRKTQTTLDPGSSPHLNRVTTFAYDADGNQTSTTADPGASPHLALTTSSTYDDLGRLASKTDANSHTSSYTYDVDGNQATVTAPDGGVTANTYDAAGRQTAQIVDYGTGHLNETTTKAYDDAGRLTSTTIDPGSGHLNLTSATTYDPVGNKLTDTDPAGKVTHYTYDAANRLVSTTTPLGEVTTTSYDAVGNKTSTVVDPGTGTHLNQTTTFAYDAADRPTQTVVDPGTGTHLAITSSTAYDAAGRVSSKTDPNSHTTSYVYDHDGRQTEVDGPDGSVTTLTYDNAGNVLTRTDDNNHTTTFTYDAADRQVSKEDPLSNTWTYAYDGVGNKTQMVDGNGNATTSITTDGTTTYGYDAADRLTSVDYSDSTPDVSYTYDLAGRKASMTDGAGTVGYTYDLADHLLTSTRNSSSGFAYAYDTAGRLASRQYPDGTTTSYGYDDDSRMSTVTVGSDTTGYTYNTTSDVTATIYPNGWTEQRAYDAAGRLKDIRSVKSGSSDLAVATYTRDAAGNPTTIVRDGVTENYGYDSSDRVTGVCYGGALSTCASGSKITYSYDKVGNRLTQAKFGTTTNYFYDAGDELCWTGAASGSSCSTVPSGNTAYTFDHDGQQTVEGTKGYVYDLSGKLTEADNSSSPVATFSYDGDGNRLAKTASSVTTDYAWDTNFDLPMLAHESQGSTVLREYRYGDRLLSMNSGGGVYYFQHDALDSTSAITKSTGAIEWMYTYDPFGDARATTQVDPGAPSNKVGFIGSLADSETGLYDLRARMYVPGSGIFLSTDPLPPDLSNGLVSPFSYANARPTLLTDPSGQRPADVDEVGGQPCTGGGFWFYDPTECAPTAQGGSEADSSQHADSAAESASDTGVVRVTEGVTMDLLAIHPPCLGPCEAAPAELQAFCSDSVHNAVVCLQAQQMANEAIRETMELIRQGILPAADLGYDRDGNPYIIPGGLADAFRHAYWSGQMTLRFGDDKEGAATAKHITDLYEGVGHSIPGCPSPTNCDSAFGYTGEMNMRSMDLHNNAMGRQAALGLGDVGYNQKSVDALVDRLIAGITGDNHGNVMDLWVTGPPGGTAAERRADHYRLYSIKYGRVNTSY